MLITGKADDNSYHVNDPAFKTETYDYAGMSHFVEYRPNDAAGKWKKRIE